jgi:hypothetical protein
LVFTDSQNRPHTHPCHLWPQWPEFDASHRASVSARVAAATACCRNTTRVERVSEGRHSSGGGGGDLRRFGFRKHRRMHESNGTAAQGPVKVSRSLPSVWRLVVPRAVLCHLRDPFCRVHRLAIGKSLGFAASKNSPSLALSPPASPGLMRVAASAGRSVADAQSNPAPA